MSIGGGEGGGSSRRMKDGLSACHLVQATNVEGAENTYLYRRQVSKGDVGRRRIKEYDAEIGAKRLHDTTDSKTKLSGGNLTRCQGETCAVGTL